MAETDYLNELLGPSAMDLGDGHFARLFVREDGGEFAGFFHVHPAAGGNHIPEGEPCAGTVTFDVPAAGDTPGPRWQLHSIRPLHVEPSIQCSCGRHGFVRAGKWEEA